MVYLTIIYESLKEWLFPSHNSFFKDFKFTVDDIIKCEVMDDKHVLVRTIDLNDVKVLFNELNQCQRHYLGYMGRENNYILLTLQSGQQVRLAISVDGGFIGHIVPMSSFYYWYCSSESNGPLALHDYVKP